MKHNNLYNYYNERGQHIAMTWKVGKFWLTTLSTIGVIGAFKSFRKAHAAILRNKSKVRVKGDWEYASEFASLSNDLVYTIPLRESKYL